MSNVRSSGTRISEIGEHLRSEQLSDISRMVDDGISAILINDIKEFSDATIKFLLSTINPEAIKDVDGVTFNAVKDAFATKARNVIIAAT